jgi:hypothetical protein
MKDERLPTTPEDALVAIDMPEHQLPQIEA